MNIIIIVLISLIIVSIDTYILSLLKKRRHRIQHLINSDKFKTRIEYNGKQRLQERKKLDASLISKIKFAITLLRYFSSFYKKTFKSRADEVAQI